MKILNTILKEPNKIVSLGLTKKKQKEPGLKQDTKKLRAFYLKVKLNRKASKNL